MTTVYGGNEGVILFLQNQSMESAYRFEDSGHEIVPVEIPNLYIKKKSAITNYSFREIKMYGTIFNHLGYMANAGYNNGCCVPLFIFDTLHKTNKKTQENE